ncbi:mCG1030645 [Mus musculus]|nr:mCG1030645 [Mus musculus]
MFYQAPLECPSADQHSTIMEVPSGKNVALLLLTQRFLLFTP